MAKTLIALLTFVLLSTAAYAEHNKNNGDDYDNFNSDGKSYSQFNDSRDDVFRDWNNTLKQLSAQGVDPNEINWDDINPLCPAVTGKTDVYNKCRYNKAIIYSQYQKDSTLCKADAEQKYFRYLKNENGRDNSLNNQNAGQFKESAFIMCMRNNGWMDPESWKAGKGSPHPNR